MEVTDANIPAIECSHVASGYNGNILMRDINLTIARGEIVFILGGSGCGKSTLFKHMIGQVPPVSGTIRILGRETTGDVREEERLKTLRSVGVMYQSGALFGNLSCCDGSNRILANYRILFRCNGASVSDFRRWFRWSNDTVYQTIRTRTPSGASACSSCS